MNSVTIYEMGTAIAEVEVEGTTKIVGRKRPDYKPERDMIEVKIDEQIAVVSDEIKTRESVLPAFSVKVGVMTQKYADRELAVLRAVRRTLMFAKRDHGADYGTSGEPDEKL